MTQGDLFNSWNKQKQAINEKADVYQPKLFPKTGEVWMIALGKNIGYEQNGIGSNFSRPVLVFKKFNNQMYLGIPLSSKQKNIDFYFNYTDPLGNSVAAILAQLKLISIKRFYRKMYLMDSSSFESIKRKLQKILM